MIAADCVPMSNEIAIARRAHGYLLCAGRFRDRFADSQPVSMARQLVFAGVPLPKLAPIVPPV